MKQETLKAKRSDKRYIDSFITKGNRKLTDYTDTEKGIAFRYAQFNLPAKKTCPFATADCKRFCYAKRDERFTAPKENRERSFKTSLEENFAERMIYTIETELTSKRFAGAVMVLRIHESGDFYNKSYLEKWIKVFKAFSDRNVIFQFYTKSFEYFAQLSNVDHIFLTDSVQAGKVAISLSYDKSMPLKQYAKLLAVYNHIVMGSNIYAAIKADSLEEFRYDTQCDCADCAKCGKCVRTNGQIVAVAIH